jgi:hypothetical protein
MSVPPEVLIQSGRPGLRMFLARGGPVRRFSALGGSCTEETSCVKLVSCSKFIRAISCREVLDICGGENFVVLLDRDAMLTVMWILKFWTNIMSLFSGLKMADLPMKLKLLKTVRPKFLYQHLRNNCSPCDYVCKLQSKRTTFSISPILTVL